MSGILQKLLQQRVLPTPKPKWPKWIEEALAYKPARLPAVLDPAPKGAAPETEDRRNIRLLSRISNT